MHVSVPPMCLVPPQVKRQDRTPWNWSHRHCGCWEGNLMTTEPSFQILQNPLDGATVKQPASLWPQRVPQRNTSTPSGAGEVEGTRGHWLCRWLVDYSHRSHSTGWGSQGHHRAHGPQGGINVRLQREGGFLASFQSPWGSLAEQMRLHSSIGRAPKRARAPEASEAGRLQHFSKPGDELLKSQSTVPGDCWSLQQGQQRPQQLG